jgi:RNA polymerase sigma-70 factor (ECF subfamily)
MGAGSEAAYREFHEQYCRRLLRYLLVITHGQEQTARDALQATLVRVVRYIKPFRSEEAFWSWLTVLARSAAVDTQRKEHRYQGLLQRFFSRSPAPVPLSESTPETELQSLLESNLATLGPDELNLVQRKYFQHQPVAEIAASLGLTEKAVDSRLVRVRRKLKKLILAQLHEKR